MKFYPPRISDFAVIVPNYLKYVNAYLCVFNCVPLCVYVHVVYMHVLCISVHYSRGSLRNVMDYLRSWKYRLQCVRYSIFVLRVRLLFLISTILNEVKIQIV